MIHRTIKGSGKGSRITLATKLFTTGLLSVSAFSLAGSFPMPATAADPGSSTINLAQPPESLDTSPMPVEVTMAYSELRISRPIVMTGAGDGSGRLFIASQTGEIYFINEDDTDVTFADAKLYLDLNRAVSYKDRENEEGLLGLAFHPEYKENGKVYVYYTTSQRPHVSVIEEYTVSADDPNKANMQSGRELIRIQQPFWNHNGGTLAFGPDGYLYVGLGDGGKANDPLLSGQDLSKLLGSILRIDINTTEGELPYGIPKDNPFIDRDGAWPEIYAYGLRNVWRMSFDDKTGALWAADVGQNDWEELNVIVSGGNYGWSLREGGNPFRLNGDGSGPRRDLIDPLVEYPHTDDWGKSVTGGEVYRGKETPELDGYYLYGDYVTGKLWALKYDYDSKTVKENRPIDWSNLPVFTFGNTDSGEILMSTMSGGGRIYKFIKK